MGALQDRLARAGIAVVLMMLAALLALSAIGLLGATLYLALLPYLSPPQAAAATAGAAVVLALVLLLVARGIAGRSSRPSASATVGSGSRRSGSLGGGLGVVSGLGQDIGHDAEALIRTHASKAIMASLVAGFALGVSPRLRRGLWRLLQ